MTPEELLKEVGEPTCRVSTTGIITNQTNAPLEPGLELYTADQLIAARKGLEEENARLRFALADTEALELGTSERLAAEQLNNKLLREALEAVIKVHGYESGIPVEAISTQASTEALDAYVKQKIKEYY